MKVQFLLLRPTKNKSANNFIAGIWVGRLKGDKMEVASKEQLKDIFSKYAVHISPIPEGIGGGFRATIPQLGEYAFVGDGETREEALLDLENVALSILDDSEKFGAH